MMRRASSGSRSSSSAIALDVGKQHGDLFALAFQGGARGENLLGEMFGSIGEWRTLRVNLRGPGRRWPAGPHKHSTVFIDSEALGLNKFSFQVLDILVVQVKAALERSVGHPILAPEQIEHLRQDLVKCHNQFSLCVMLWDRAVPLTGDGSVLSHRLKPEGKTPGEEVLPLLLERVEERTVDIPQQAFET